MKTRIYIDGYNLFYGCLKNGPYKWLDIHALFVDRILRAQCPEASDVELKFFTADIKAKIATRGQQAQSAQQERQRQT